MKTSSSAKVRALYEQSAESYSKVMDSEIDLPVYADVLGRLFTRIVDIPGVVVDTSCGPGHMLARYRERHDPARSLIGIDLSPRMVAIARERLGRNSDLLTGDMRDLDTLDSGSAAALLSFFAIHHLAPEEVSTALREWHRVLCRGGQLLVAAWEGAGPIDYGEASDVVAIRYTKGAITDRVPEAGFALNRCVVVPVEDMPMDAVYLEATKGTAA